MKFPMAARWRPKLQLLFCCTFLTVCEPWVTIRTSFVRSPGKRAPSGPRAASTESPGRREQISSPLPPRFSLCKTGVGVALTSLTRHFETGGKCQIPLTSLSYPTTSTFLVLSIYAYLRFNQQFQWFAAAAREDREQVVTLLFSSRHFIFPPA